MDGGLEGPWLDDDVFYLVNTLCGLGGNNYYSLHLGV